MVEMDANSVLLEYGDSALRLKFHESDGEGSWSLKLPNRRESQGGFQMSENGTLISQAWAGQPVELDQAAIEWVQQLTHEAARQKAC